MNNTTIGPRHTYRTACADRPAEVIVAWIPALESYSLRVQYLDVPPDSPLDRLCAIDHLNHFPAGTRVSLEEVLRTLDALGIELPVPMRIALARAPTHPSQETIDWSQSAQHPTHEHFGGQHDNTRAR